MKGKLTSEIHSYIVQYRAKKNSIPYKFAVVITLLFWLHFPTLRYIKKILPQKSLSSSVPSAQSTW